MIDYDALRLRLWAVVRSSEPDEEIERFLAYLREEVDDHAYEKYKEGVWDGQESAV